MTYILNNILDVFLSKEPITYSFTLKSMTTEKIEFKLPMVFSFSPILPTDDIEGTMRYARYFSDSTDRDSLRSTILGIVEGEARSIAANMTVEDLFIKRDEFRQAISDKVGDELKELGLKILNANIKELTDLDESNNYFTYRKQKAIETANYEAKVDVAEARKKGEIGIRERTTAARIVISQLDSMATREENTRNEEISYSEASLHEAKARARQTIEVAQIEANMVIKNVEYDLQQKVDLMRQKQKLEQLRADQLGKTKVDAEKDITQSIGESSAMRILADSNLYDKINESEGNRLCLVAYGNGLANLNSACASDHSVGKFYMSLQSGLFEKLAHQQAIAVQDMKPQISVWNTGGTEIPSKE